MSIIYINPYQFAAAAAYDPDAQDFINRVIAADVAAGNTSGLEVGVQDAYNEFFVGCKADGTFNALNAACILKGAQTLPGALVPLVSTMPAPTNFNFVAGDYDRKTGLVGDGSTKHLDANLVTAASNSHQAVYRTSGFQPGRTLIGCVVDNGSQGCKIGFQFSSNIGFMNGSNTFPSSGLGAFAGQNRANLAGSFDWRVSPNSGSFTQAAYTGVTSSTAVFAEDRNGISTANYSNARIAFYSIGESLDLALLDTRVTTLISDLAAAIP